MAGRGANKNPEPKQPAVVQFCRECANCTEVWEPHNLLSLKGEPTLGTCPYWTQSRCVLLSQKACKEHFEPRKQDATSNSVQQV